MKIGRILPLVLFAFAGPALACSSLTPEGEAKRERWEGAYLRKESDKRIRGVFYASPKERLEANDYYLIGFVEVREHGKINLYRIEVDSEINCGFPYYYLQDGDAGLFYLKKIDEPDPDDLRDGYIDNFRYIHADIGERSN